MMASRKPRPGRLLLQESTSKTTKLIDLSKVAGFALATRKDAIYTVLDEETLAPVDFVKVKRKGKSLFLQGEDGNEVELSDFYTRPDASAHDSNAELDSAHTLIYSKTAAVEETKPNSSTSSIWDWLSWPVAFVGGLLSGSLLGGSKGSSGPVITFGNGSTDAAAASGTTTPPPKANSTPTVEIQTTATKLPKNAPSTVTFKLSEASDNFSVNDIAVTGGTLSNFRGSGSVYAADFTPDATATDAIFTVAKGSFSNASAETNAVGSSVFVAIGDTTVPGVTPPGTTPAAAPTVEIQTTATKLPKNAVSTVMFKLSEASDNFSDNDIAVTGGTLSNFRGSGSVYAADFTPDATATDAIFTVTKGSFSNASAETNAVGSSFFIAIGDTTVPGVTPPGTTPTTDAPTVEILSSSTHVRVDETVSLIFKLSVASERFSLSDISVVGGSLSNFRGSGFLYEADFTPDSNAQLAAIGVASNSFTNAENVGNVASTTTVLTISGTSIPATDTTPPTVTMVTAKTTLATGEAIGVNFLLSEASADFAESDISVTGGTLSNFQGAGTSYSATFTPSAGVSSANLAIASGQFSDAAGNFNADGAQSNNYLNYTVGPVADTTPPTVAASTTKTALADGEAVTVNFLLSENSTTFAASDVTAVGGVLSNFQGSGTSYSATFTPDAGVSAANVSIASGKFADAAGNLNTDGAEANNRVSYTVSAAPDTTPPTVAVSAAKTALAAGEAVTVNFLLSEASADFVEADIAVTGGTLSNFQGAGTNYSATFTPSAGMTSASLAIASGQFSDAAGNFNTDGAEVNNRVDLTVASGDINGTGGNDLLTGTANADVLNGLAGNDTLDGGAGSDRLLGGDGNDTLVYDSSDVLIDGGAGTDTLLFKANANLGTDAVTLSNIEILDMRDTVGAAVKEVRLSANDVASMLTPGQTELTVLGDAYDTIYSQDIWTVTSGPDAGFAYYQAQTSAEQTVTLKMAPTVEFRALVTEISADTISGTLTTGDVLTITVSFDHAIALTTGGASNVSLALSNGASAYLQSVSGSTAIFKYTVAATDTTLIDGVDRPLYVTALQGESYLTGLNGVSRINSSLEAVRDLNLDLDGQLFVDGVPPKIVGMVKTPNTDGSGAGLITVTFSETVNVLAGADLPYLALHGTATDAGSQAYLNLNLTSARTANQLTELYFSYTEDPLEVIAMVDEGQQIRDPAGNVSLVAVDGTNNLTGIDINAGAGPFTSTLVHVSLQDALTGELLWADLQPGHAMSLPSQSLVKDHPFVMVSLTDQDETTKEYLDELTGQTMSLSRQGEGMTLRAVVSSAHVESITVTTLTELTVRWLDETTAAPDFAQTYAEISKAVACLFNVQNVWSTDIAFTNEDDFDVTDGIQAAEAYGKALALLSAMDAVTGSPQATLTFLTDHIHYDAESQALFTQETDLAPLVSLMESAQAIWTSVHPDIALNTTLALESLTIHVPDSSSGPLDLDLVSLPLNLPETAVDVTDVDSDVTPASPAVTPFPVLDLTIDATLDQRLWG
jgi:predicted nucleic-acid-binding Zn-ribbon protein